jgi:transposase
VKQKTLLPELTDVESKARLNAEQLLILAQLIEENNDATLEELRYLLYGKLGFSVSRATIGRMIKLLNITVKKNSIPFRQRHRPSSHPAM